MRKLIVILIAAAAVPLVIGQMLAPIVAGTAPAVMPSGALGIWYADQYVTSPRNEIPNAASPTAATANLFSTPRRLFSNAIYWGGSNVTVVDNATTCPDGSSEASTVVWGSADAYVLWPSQANFPSGTYTLAVDVRTTDSSTTGFRMGKYTSAATKSATSSWQSFSTTFTHSGPGNPLLTPVLSLNTSTPAHLAICNARLYAGSSDLGVETLAGHMVFGTGNYDSNQPTYSNGVLTLNASGKFGTIQLPSATALTAWTAIGVGQRKAAPGGIFQPFFSKIQNYLDFNAVYAGNLMQPYMLYGGSGVLNDPAGGLWQYKDNDWHIITSRYATPNATVFMEDIKAAPATGAGLSATIQDLFVGTSINTGNYSRYVFNAMALWPRALSDTEVRTAVALLTARAAKSSITIGNGRFLDAEGDSITFGSLASNGSYANLFGVNSSPPVNGVVRAISGSTLATVNARVSASDDAVLPPNKAGRMFIYTLLIGANDLSGYAGGSAQYAADVATHMLARKAAGWDKTVLITVTPRNDSTFNTARNALNAIYTGAGWAAGHGVDKICNFAADPTMGPDAAAANATLYSDGVHPTNTGQANLEVIYRACINGL